MSILHPNRRHGRKSDKEYLAFVRSLPCIVCILPWKLDGSGIAYSNVQKSITEAAHTGSHGIGQKSSDRDALPLCAIEHHREGPTSYHKLGTKFFAYHGLDRKKLVADLQRQFGERE